MGRWPGARPAPRPALAAWARAARRCRGAPAMRRVVLRQGWSWCRGSSTVRSVERFQRGQVEQFDAAVLQAQQASRLQFAQRMVHGLARQAQHLRQLLLRNAHPLRGTGARQAAVAMRERRQPPRDACRRRQQLRFLDIVEGLAGLGRQQLPERLPPCRLLRQALRQGGARHVPQRRGAGGARVMSARQAIEQADLAEPAAGLEQAQHRGLARCAAGVDLHGAAGDTIQAIEAVTARKQGLAGNQPAQAAVLQQRLPQRRRQLAEPRARTHRGKWVAAWQHRAGHRVSGVRLGVVWGEEGVAWRARQPHAGLHVGAPGGMSKT
ncbi:hypothetical protein CBM2623_B80117 [Cupriavidus taiwanensis]|nr:hypothetical protein CBM2608_B90118 [Cupriavidus taiwanensis]SPA36506.1 hypothetical protein CBM2623_B80117 [Cupriavidus taiwanensis]